MLGSVWEWCLDYWHESYNGAPADGSSWESGGDAGRRVMRGGSWGVPAVYCRAAFHNWSPPGFRNATVGFRVVAVAPTP
jgi:formylglycine-generating enzyme required for sulfatase activity